MDGATLDRYVRALAVADIPQPKELDVSITPVAITDALVDEIAAVADEVGAPRFAIMDDALVTFAKVRGNPWDLDDILAGLRRLSRRLPELTFDVELEPDGNAGILRGGELALAGSDELARWVAAHPRPHFGGGSLTAQVGLHAPAAELAELRESISSRAQATLADVADGIAIATTGARELVLAIYAVKAMILVEPPWRVSLELSGDVHGRISVDDVMGLLALELVIATWLRDAVMTEQDPASPAPAVYALPPAPALARVAHPDRLVLKLRDQSRFALGREGSFESLAPDEPPSLTRGRVLGELDGERVISLLVELQLGRIRNAIMIRASDGTERESAALINASAIALDRDRRRVLATPERDGVRMLVAIDPKTMDVAPLRELALEPRELFICGDSIIALAIELWRFQLIRLAEHGDADEPIATLQGRPWNWSRLGDTLRVIALDETSTPAAATYGEVSLVDGSMRSVPIGHGHSSTFAIAGDWLAWCDRDDAAEVRLFHRLELQRTIAPVAGFRTWAIDVSPSGAVARVVTDDKTARLEVSRDDARVELAVPLCASAKWALDP